MRTIASILIGILVTVIVFGIALSLLWAIGSDARSFKLLSALLSAALAVGLGGFTVAWIARGHALVLPALDF